MAVCRLEQILRVVVEYFIDILHIGAPLTYLYASMCLCLYIEGAGVSMQVQGETRGGV